VLFPITKQDDRLGLKEILIGFENDGQYKAYRLDDEKNNVLNDQINSKPIALLQVSFR
jgi:hypothetical protein